MVLKIASFTFSCMPTLRISLDDAPDFHAVFGSSSKSPVHGFIFNWKFLEHVFLISVL